MSFEPVTANFLTKSAWRSSTRLATLNNTTIGGESRKHKDALNAFGEKRLCEAGLNRQCQLTKKQPISKRKCIVVNKVEKKKKQSAPSKPSKLFLGELQNVRSKWIKNIVSA